MTPLTNILFPLALDEAESSVSIKNARRGGLFHCLDCGQDMSAKQGRLRAWHFAHKPPQALACDPNRVLHRTAQALILSGFRNAVAQSGEYTIGRLCAHCGGPLITNAAQAGSIIEREVSAVAGTRSDLVITHADGEHLVIEVVHTHDLDESAATAYSQSGIPVLKIRPVWRLQDDGPAMVASEPGLEELSLDEGALAYDALNPDPCICAGCKSREKVEAARQRSEEASRHQLEVEGHQSKREREEAETARQHRWELEEERLQELKRTDRKAYIAELHRIASRLQSRS